MNFVTPSTLEGSDDQGFADSNPEDGSPRPASSHAASTTSHNVSGSQAGADASQKRRRVTRACDECRKKKIKCDGKQPCNHCTIYGYDCTYDQPSHRRRNAAPQVVEQLEKKLTRAEALLRAFLPPGTDLSDPGLDSLIEGQAGHSSDANSGAVSPRYRDSIHSPDGTESIESMVRATANLDVDERGNWDYHSHSSGLSFMRAMRDQFGDIFGSDDPDGMKGFRKPPKSYDTLDIPSPAELALSEPRMSTDNPYEMLPSKSRAIGLSRDTLDDAGAILGIVHRPSFFHKLDAIYAKRSSGAALDGDDRQFVPLLFSVIAVGTLYARSPSSDLSEYGYTTLTIEGSKYFWTARKLLDVADCRELVSLQALVFMTFFLQCSARLSTCYTFVGLALRTALRMGLHRSFRNSFTPIEEEIRKRTFWVIRTFDIYVGAMIGLPQTLTDDEIDQDLPSEVNDEYITDEAILPMPSDDLCTMSAMNAQYRMATIVRKIVKYIYPIKGFHNTEEPTTGVYRVSYAKITEVESDLQQWMEALPQVFHPGGECLDSVFRLRGMLRICYAFAQLTLYRPFLHYVSTKQKSKPVDQRAYACAAACISVARNAIHITAELNKRGLLNGAFWFLVYTNFFAILSLIFYVLENPGDVTAVDIMRDAYIGKETLIALATQSMAADRCTESLERLFRHADEVVKRTSTKSKTGQRHRKRSTPSSTGDDRLSEHRGSFTSDPNQKPAGLGQFGLRPNKASNFTPRKGPKPQQINVAAQPGHVPMPLGRGFDNFGHFGGPAVNVHLSNAVPAIGPHGAFDYNAMQGNIAVESPQQQHFNEVYADKINDVSTMMFPSADPFAYPNPPMLTLEHEGQHHYQGGASGNDEVSGDWGAPGYINASTASAHTVSADEHIDVQMLGGLDNNLLMNPPHLDRRQAHMEGQQPFFGEEQGQMQHVNTGWTDGMPHAGHQHMGYEHWET